MSHGARWRTGLKAFLATFSVYFLAVIGINILTRSVWPLADPIRPYLVYPARLVILFGSVRLFYRGPTLPFLGLRRPFARPFIAGSLLAAPFILAWVIGSLVYGIPLRPSAHSTLALAFAFLNAGLFEEGTFRGVLFNRLSSVTNWFTAALLAGVFFGPAHLANLLVGQTTSEISVSIVAGLIMSFPLGYLYYRMRGNLWTCVAFHFLIAGSMDAVISEQAIRAHLDRITPVTSVGLALSLILVFVLMSRESFVRWARDGSARPQANPT